MFIVTLIVLCTPLSDVNSYRILCIALTNLRTFLLNRVALKVGKVKCLHFNDNYQPNGSNLNESNDNDCIATPHMLKCVIFMSLGLVFILIVSMCKNKHAT